MNCIRTNRCMPHRVLGRMDWSELFWIFGLLMVGYLWGFFLGMTFAAATPSRDNVIRHAVAGQIPGALTRAGETLET